MGTSSLESRLRARLLGVLVPMFAGIGIVAVVVTAHVLTAADDDRARTIARGVAQSMRIELAEGDSREDAERESRAPFDPAQVRVLIDPTPAPDPLAALAAGACADLSTNDVPWRACSLVEQGMKVNVAIRADAHHAAMQTLVQWMIGVVILALLGALAAARVALRPPLLALARLVEWSERAASGPRSAPPSNGTLEIDRLGRSFDALVGELMDALARERANSAHIAHELRTPLTAIVAELAAMPGGDAVLRLRDDAARLSRVIDAILLLSEPRARRSDTVVNVADLVRKLSPPGTKIDAPDEALVEAEPHLVELALFNLLDNAAKYAPSGVTSVQVARESDRVRVGVIDAGPGLAPEARTRIFDRYWREASDGEGRGLGLALVRAVAERHGGGADARPGPGAGGLDVGFTMGPVLGWHEHAEPR